MARNVRLTMMTIHNKLQPMAERRAQMLELLVQAGKEGSDIVLMPELADHHRTHEAVAAHQAGKEAVRQQLGLTLESPWLQQVAGYAKQYKMVVIPCVALRDGDKFYDATPVYGPDGSLLGRYAKTHLAPGEEKKMDAGNSLEPIDTPYGKLGIFICWDIHFPEVIRTYQLKGADLLLWSTMRHGPFERDFYTGGLQTRCMTLGMPMGVSTFAADNQLVMRVPMNSVIIDACGFTVAGGMRAENSLVKATIDLDMQMGLNPEWKLPADLDYRTYIVSQRRPELYGALTAPQQKR